MRLDKTITLTLLLGVLALTNTGTQAAPRLPALFVDGMVLQSGQPVPIWGWADPGEAVNATLGDDTAMAVADAQGKWRAELPPLPINASPQTLQVRGADGSSVDVHNVLVGEVWLCSGPSNLYWPVAKCDNAEAEMAGANIPSIRFFTVKRATTDTPQVDCEGTWTVCSPETIGPMSGIAYFFSRRIHKVTNTPIGILQSFWGGSRMESWTSQEALNGNPALRPVLDAWEAEADAFKSGAAIKTYEAEMAAWEALAAAAQGTGEEAPQKPTPPSDPNTSQHRPACLYNGMIAPLIPYGIRGAMIYQGLGNLARGEQNAALLETQIQDWRKRWGLGPIPFGLVQPAPYASQGFVRDSDDAYALSREAQQIVATKLPNVGIALTLDVDATGELHFTNKQIVGARLAKWALSEVYDHPEPYLGPLFDRAVVVGQRVRVHFKNADSGLRTNDDKAPAHFTLAGADGVFHPATATIDGATVLLQCEAVPKPITLRFAWGDTNIVNLVNSDGLPATLFRASLEVNE